MIIFRRKGWGPSSNQIIIAAVMICRTNISAEPGPRDSLGVFR
jgi:hypothetical protein